MQACSESMSCKGRYLPDLAGGARGHDGEAGYGTTVRVYHQISCPMKQLSVVRHTAGHHVPLFEFRPSKGQLVSSSATAFSRGPALLPAAPQSASLNETQYPGTRGLAKCLDFSTAGSAAMQSASSRRFSCRCTTLHRAVSLHAFFPVPSKWELEDCGAGGILEVALGYPGVGRCPSDLPASREGCRSAIR